MYHDTKERWYLYRVLSRLSWDALQSLLECHPGSSIEHLYAGLFVLKMPADAPCPCEAKKRPGCSPGPANNPHSRLS